MEKIAMSHILLLLDPSIIMESLDFEKNKYSVITYRAAATRIAANIRHCLAAVEAIDADLMVMDSTLFEENYPMILSAAKLIERRIGKIDIIVGIIEPSIVPAAKLRRDLGLPGLSVEMALNFRDKILMKKALQHSGVDMPRYLDLAESQTKEAMTFFTSCLKGAVFKPRSQAGSRGVTIVRNTAELEQRLSDPEAHRCELEEFIEGDVFHIDGVVINGKIEFLCAMKYIYPPIEWERDFRPYCAVMTEDNGVRAKAHIFAQQIIDAMGYENGVFHLEAFFRNEQFVFLEIAARAGGAGVASSINRCFGVNLMQCSYDLEVGNPVSLNNRGILDRLPFCVGWLFMPSPTREPIEITGLFANLQNFASSEVYSKISNIGDRLNTRPSSYAPTGEFIFKARNSSAIEMDISMIINSFKVQYRKLD